MSSDGAVIISCRGIYKRYPKGNWIFRDAWLDIREGELLFLLGTSGSGKTTFIQIVTGWETYDKGSIQVEGRDIISPERFYAYRWRRRLGIVFQDFRLLGQHTVWDNIALPLILQGYKKKDVEKRVMAVLSLVRLEGKENMQCRFLSGGEQQRTAIARAIVHSPRIVLADEPTGNLDDLHTSVILDMFSALRSRGMTILVATHDKRLPLSVEKSRIVMIKNQGFVEVVPVLKSTSQQVLRSDI